VLITIPLNSYLFEKGEKKDTLSASTYRNVASMSANFLFFFILALLVNVFNISFLIASGCMLLLVGVSYFFNQDVVLRSKGFCKKFLKL
jgi:small neutral amino acid transporter SnatA (MarC family)